MDTCRLLWTYKTGYEADDLTWVSSSTVLGDIDADGKLEVVLGSWDDSLHAINAEDGSPLWRFADIHDIVSTPALADIDADSLLEVVVGLNTGVYALNGEDGSLLWLVESDWIGSSPAVGDLDGDGSPEVVIGCTALRGIDGSTLWGGPPGPSWTSHALGDIDQDGLPEVIVAGYGTSWISALDGEDGQRLWFFESTGGVHSSPALGDMDCDGRLEVAVSSVQRDGPGKVFALNGEDGSLLWSYVPGFWVNSSPALGDLDNDGDLDVVVGSDDSRVYALNGPDGDLLWSYETGWLVTSSPALGDVDGDGKLEVIVGSWDCNLYALNGEDGSVQWSFATIGYAQWSPSLGDIDMDRQLEVIYNGRDLTVYALDGPACEPVEPWSVKSQGYWRRQCKDDNHEDICAYVDSVHILADLFDAFDCDSVCDLMDVNPPENGMCRKARRQFMALLLNIASGKLAVCNCLEDGGEVADVIGEIDALLSNGPDSHTCECAKTLADGINNGIGIVPCDAVWAQAPPKPVQPPSISVTPNPFVTSTVIEYELRTAERVRLRIYDCTGRLISTLVDGVKSAGSHQIEWEGLDNHGRKAPSGVYFLRVETEQSVKSDRIVLIR